MPEGRIWLGLGDVMGFEAGGKPGILSAFLLWPAKAKQVGFALVSVLGKCGL